MPRARERGSSQAGGAMTLRPSPFHTRSGTRARSAQPSGTIRTALSLKSGTSSRLRAES